MLLNDLKKFCLYYKAKLEVIHYKLINKTYFRIRFDRKDAIQNIYMQLNLKKLNFLNSIHCFKLGLKHLNSFLMDKTSQVV